MSSVLANPYVGDAGDFLLVNHFARRTSWLHGAMTGFAEYGLVLFAVLMVAGWLLARRSGVPARIAALAWAGLGTLVAVGINQPIVTAIHERRPYQTIPHVLVLVSRSTDFGFPSDHATMAGAVATGLLYVNRRLGLLAWAAALVMAFARVYTGAHYPHDVVAGLVLGAVVIVVGRLVAQPVLTVVADRIGRTRLHPLVRSGPVAAS